MVPLADDGLSVTGRAEEGLRRLAVPGGLGGRGLRAGRPEDAEARRLLLHGARRGRHGRPADEPHGRRRAVEDASTGPWENSPYNPIIRTVVARRALVVEGARHAGRGAGRPVVRRLPRVRERLLQPRPPDAARADRVDRRRLVQARRAPTSRRRSGSRRARRCPHGLALSDDFSTNKMGVQWSFYKGTGVGQGPLPLRGRRAGAEGQGHDAGRQLAALVRLRRPRLRDRGRDRPRPGRHGRPAGVLQQPALRRARRLGHEPRHAPLRHGARRARSRPTSAGACSSG